MLGERKRLDCRYRAAAARWEPFLALAEKAVRAFGVEVVEA